MKDKRSGMSYRMKVNEINRVYDEKVKLGLSNREIWLRFIYPVWGICERTFYNILKGVYNPNGRDIR